MFSSEKIGGRTIFRSTVFARKKKKKMLVDKFVGWNIFGPTIFWADYFGGQKRVGVKNKFGHTKIWPNIFPSGQILGGKSFRPIIFPLEFFPAEKFFGRKSFQPKRIVADKSFDRKLFRPKIFFCLKSLFLSPKAEAKGMGFGGGGAGAALVRNIIRQNFIEK